MSNDKTLTEHAEHHAGKRVELVADLEPDEIEAQLDDAELAAMNEPDAEDDACAATAYLRGKLRTCAKHVGHDGKHKHGAVTWRRRSGDVR